MQRAFCLAPRVLPRASLAHLGALQPLFNRLYDAVSRDTCFVKAALAPSAAACPWAAEELAVYGRVAARQAGKPRLLLPNSVYLQHASQRHEGQQREGQQRDGREQEGGGFVMVVGNVQVACRRGECTHPCTHVLYTLYSTHGTPHSLACR